MEKVKIQTEFDDYDKHEIQKRIDEVHEELNKIDNTEITEDKISSELDALVKSWGLVEGGKYNVDKLIDVIRCYIINNMKLTMKVNHLFKDIESNSSMEQLQHLIKRNYIRLNNALKEQNEELKDRLIEAMQKVINTPPNFPLGKADIQTRLHELQIKMYDDTEISNATEITYRSEISNREHPEPVEVKRICRQYCDEQFKNKVITETLTNELLKEAEARKEAETKLSYLEGLYEKLLTAK